MSKLRLIKERTENKDVETDLRGLGEADILKSTAPFACLAVRGLDEDERTYEYLKGLLIAYDLKAEMSEEQGTLHLQTRILHAGEHKRQAVTLFVAALDILRRHPGASVLLCEISRLHEALQNGIRYAGHPRQDLLQERTMTWKSDGHALAMDAQVGWHLRQAGFDLAHSDHVLKLTASELEAQFRELAGPIQPVAHVDERKAA